MDHLHNQGEEVAFRIGYDDVNESLSHQGIVHKTLRTLGCTKEVLKEGAANDAYSGILRLGLPPGGTAGGAAGGAGSGCAGQEQQQQGAEFDAQRAAAFWSEHVFVKTFRERRRCVGVEAACAMANDMLLSSNFSFDFVGSCHVILPLPCV